MGAKNELSKREAKPRNIRSSTRSENFKIFTAIINYIPVGEKEGITASILSKKPTIIELLSPHSESKDLDKALKKSIQRVLYDIKELCNLEVSDGNKWTYNIDEINSRGKTISYRFGEDSNTHFLSVAVDECEEVIAVYNYLQHVGVLQKAEQFKQLAEKAELKLKSKKSARGKRKAINYPSLVIYPSGIMRKHTSQHGFDVLFEVKTKLLDAIENCRFVNITYVKEGEETPNTRVLPICIGIKGYAQYLICVPKEKNEAINKDNFKLLTYDIKKIKDVQTEQYSEIELDILDSISNKKIKKAMQFSNDGPDEKIVLFVHEIMKDNLKSTPLESVRKSVEKMEDGSLKMEFEMPISLDLRHFLMSHMQFIRVEAPERLKKYLRKDIAKAAELNPDLFPKPTTDST